MEIRILGGLLCAVSSCFRLATGLLPAERSSWRPFSDRIGLGGPLPAELPLRTRLRGPVVAGHIDDSLFLPSALMLVITVGPMIQLPSVGVVLVALGVIIGVVSPSEKVRSAV